MKKIFLLFMILGLSLISFIDTQAFTHTTYDGYDLDTINQDLGGVSIRDFFENYNLISNYDFSNGTTGWLSTASTLSTSNNILTQTNDGTSSTMRLGYKIINGNGLSNEKYYVRLSSKHKYQPSNYYLILRDTGAYGNILASVNVVSNIDLDKFNNHSEILTTNNSYTNNLFVYFNSGGSTINDAVDFSNIYVINLNSLNIQLSVESLDYYYLVYTILINAENAYNNGYDDGNLDGYTTGFTDGTTYGQNEYHTGNYGTLDETQGIPYNDGYNAGVAEELDTNYLLSFVQGSIAVLNAPILPNITLGVFVFVPLFFGFIAFLFRLGGKRG